MITTSGARDSSTSRSSNPTSPNTLNTRTQPGSSPRLSTSSIFERDVQDPSLPPPSSPAIPAHFSTENYIPPVLEATSIAIIDSSIDPDRVEIVSSTSHHPALASPDTYSSTVTDESAYIPTSTTNTDDQPQLGYGSSLAQPDTRRLSFISFADVVQAEHDEASHSSTGIPSPTALDSVTSSSPPLPASSSLSAMVKDQLHHPHSRGSLDVQRSGSTSQGPHGELTVETMSQALRRHGSGDLKALASPKVHSPSPLDDRNI